MFESGITQLYSTTVVDTDAGHSLTLATLPAQDEGQGPPQSVGGLGEQLGVQILLPVPTGPELFLSHAFAAVLAGGDPVETFRRLEGVESAFAAGQVGVDPTLFKFADYCATAEIVPLEQSLLSKKAAAALVTAGGGVAALAAGPLGPIVIVYFGAAILAGGGALTVAEVGNRFVDRWLKRKGL